MANPRVYFDISIGGKASGRIIMQVRRKAADFSFMWKRNLKAKMYFLLRLHNVCVLQLHADVVPKTAGM